VDILAAHRTTGYRAVLCEVRAERYKTLKVTQGSHSHQASGWKQAQTQRGDEERRDELLEN